MAAEGEDTPRPPFTPDLLADLHGDALPDVEAARLRAAVADDPQAQRTIAAFDRVRDELAALRTDPPPAPAAPVDVMDRIRAALDADIAGTPVVDLAARRRRRWAAGTAAAAAVVVFAAVALTSLRTVDTTSDDVLAQPSTPALGDDLSAAAVLGMLGHTTSALSDPVGRGDCLRANGFDASTPVLGSGPVTVRGQDGVLLILPGPQSPTLTALVVGTACGTVDPATIARQDIG